MHYSPQSTKRPNTQTNTYSGTDTTYYQLNTVYLTPSHRGSAQFTLPPTALQGGGGAHEQGSI